MSDIISLSLNDAAKALQCKKIGAVEITMACIQRICSTEPLLEALLLTDEENALALAKKMDAAGPDPLKPLWGIPVTIKDAISTKGMRTTAASRILENFIPIYDAFTVQKLRDAGAIILGKANMDEFAMGSSTENSAFKKTRNPWNLAKVPGGSSGGSAASVASGQCFASLGSDTGGSIRQPAGFCGCVGLKPTYGRVSRFGLFAFASSLDQIGPLCRSVEDCARVLSVIAGNDMRDNTNSRLPAPDYCEALKRFPDIKPLNGVRIGVPFSLLGDGLSNEVRLACRKALDEAVALGAEIVDITLPDSDISTAAYYIIAMAEASSNLARYDGVRYGKRSPGVNTLDELYTRSRSDGFGSEVKRRIMLGSYVLSSGYYDAYFKKAAQVRRLIRNKYYEALEICDVISMPVSPVTAWNMGAHEEKPLEAYLMDAYTLPINLAGLPAISIPVGLGAASGMPVGLQIIGKPFAEEKILRIGCILENYLPKIGIPNLSS